MERVVVAKSRVVDPSRTTICCTRYGNVMASRGSVIPLFIDQIKSGKPLTITDPNMTRFLMSLDEAVDLVVFAFKHASQGDLFVQKAPASTIADLAQAIQEIFGGKKEVKIIGSRHGEKLYETLLTTEEKIKAIDMGNYFRVPIDKRTLNYDKYFVEGVPDLVNVEAYTSHNTVRLNVEQVKQKLLSLPYVQQQLKQFKL